MIYYPIETLKNAGVENILVITASEQQPSFKKYLADATHIDISLSYAIQEDHKSIVKAITIGMEFLGENDDKRPT